MNDRDEQLSLDPQPLAHARTGDPWTSHAAARSIEPAKLRESQQAVLAFFRKNGPMHHDHLTRHYVGPPWQSQSGLRTRTKELVDLGLIQDTGRTVRLPSGRSSIIWEATP